MPLSEQGEEPPLGRIHGLDEVVEIVHLRRWQVETCAKSDGKGDGYEPFDF